MSMIYRPRASALASGLSINSRWADSVQRLFICHPNFGRPLDIVSGMRLTSHLYGTGDQTNTFRGTRNEGVGITTDSTKNTVREVNGDPIYTFSSGESFSFLVAANLRTFSGSNDGFWRTGTTSSGTTFFITTTGTRYPWVRLNGTNILLPGSGPTVSLGIHCYAISVWSGAYVSCFGDGSLIASATHSATTAADSVYYIGTQTLGEAIYGDYELICFRSKPWTDAELAHLTRNPRDLLAPLPRRLYFFSTAAGGTTVSVPVLSHSYSGQVPKVQARVAPGAVAHTYSVPAPKVNVEVSPAQVTHSYSPIAPKVNASVGVGVVTHTYTAQVPSIQVGGATNVTPPAVTHTYSGLAPKVNAQVRPAQVTHSYLGQAPKLSASVAAPTASHTYTGRTPTILANLAIAVPLASHVYQPLVPALPEILPRPVGGDDVPRRRKKLKEVLRHRELDETIAETVETLVRGPREVTIPAAPSAPAAPRPRPTVSPELLATYKEQLREVAGAIQAINQKRRVEREIEQDDAELLELARRFFEDL